MALGGRHTLVVKPDGTLWTTGNNERGQLGDGSPNNKPTLTFKQVASMTGFKSGCAGAWHTMALKQDGTLWAAGDTRHGALGYYEQTNPTKQITTFKQVLTEVQSVTCGVGLTMAVKQDGTLWATGSGTMGQLGDGSYGYRHSFKQVLSKVKAVATALHSTMALKQDGTLWATGTNDKGELGDGSMRGRNSFVQVIGEAQAAAAGPTRSPRRAAWLSRCTARSGARRWRCFTR